MGISRWWARCTVLALLLFVCAGVCARVEAQAEPEEPSGEDEASGDVEEPIQAEEEPAEDALETLARLREERAEHLTIRAAQVRALMADELTPTVDPQTLFSVDLSDIAMTGERGERLLRLLREVREARQRRRRRPRRRAAPNTGDPLDDAVELLTGAYSDFLTLSPERRVELIRAHNERREIAEREAAENRARLAGIQSEVEALRAFMDGTLDEARDPSDLLRLNLADTTELPRDDRLLRVIENAASGDVAVAEEIADLQSAEGELDRLRLSLLQLSGQERRALLERHSARQRAAAAETEAERSEALAAAASAGLSDTQRAREEALSDARVAQDERIRRVAEERARLLGIKEEQARLASTFDSALAGHAERHERANELRTAARELRDRSVLGGDKTREAEALYASLTTSLVAGRTALEEAVAELERPTAVPDAGEPTTSIEEEEGQLDDLRREIAETASALHQRKRELTYEQGQVDANDLVFMNRGRLALLELVGSDVRNAVTGLGPQGVSEAKGEASQIALLVRHGIATLPRYGKALLGDLTASPVPVIWSIFKVIFVLFIFFGWRAKADSVLSEMSEPEEGEDANLLHTVAWYLRRIRKPLEWLLLIWALLEYSDLSGVIGAQYLWILARWIFGGTTLILLVDAFAARQKRGRRSMTADLRLRSLKLVGWTVIILGLLLDLTSQLVGTGAIYAYVWRVCAIIAIPFAFLLVRWWRPTVFRQLDLSHTDNRLTTTIKEHRTGFLSYPAAAIGGVYLLGLGAMRIAVRNVSRLDGTRRLRAYLFRRQVARRAEESARDRTPIAPELYERFAPDAEPDALVGSYARSELDDLVALLKNHEASVSVVIGERGMGKTTFLKRLSIELDDPFYLVECGPDWDSFSKAVESELEIESIGGMRKKLKDENAIMLIDDAHFISRPTIGGMDDLDRLTDLARRSGTRWIIAMDLAAWQYIIRARDELYDRECLLPRWPESDIGELLRQRTKSAEVDASFEALVVPRQFDAPPQEDDETQKEEGYYRVLWDFSNGNPAVALHFWRESLFAGDKGPLVRLFQEPPVAELESLSPIVLYVLRSIVQLGHASAREIVTCTSLPDDDVADAVRLSMSRGYLERHEGRIRITWPWYRTITGLLGRQNLLVQS